MLPLIQLKTKLTKKYFWGSLNFKSWKVEKFHSTKISFLACLKGNSKTYKQKMNLRQTVLDEHDALKFN